MMHERTAHLTMVDISSEAHLAECTTLLWNHRRGFVVSRSPLLSNLADMPRWYAQARNRRCSRQGARISPRKPPKPRTLP